MFYVMPAVVSGWQAIKKTALKKRFERYKKSPSLQAMLFARAQTFRVAISTTVT